MVFILSFANSLVLAKERLGYQHYFSKGPWPSSPNPGKLIAFEVEFLQNNENNLLVAMLIFLLLYHVGFKIKTFGGL